VTWSSLVVGALLMCGWLLALRVPGRARLRALMVGRSVESLPRKGIFIVGAAVALVAVVGLTAALLAGLAGAVAALVVTRARARRAQEATRAGVVELLRAVAGELRSGRAAGVAFAVAVESAEPGMRVAIAPLAVVAARGDAAELADAMRAVAACGRALAGLSRFAACWQVAASSGAALAPAVDRVADALHDEIGFATSLAASLAGPRATVRLLAALPVLGLALGGAIGARPVSFLLGSPAGLCCLALAVAFDAAGVGWARRIARQAVPVALTAPTAPTAPAAPAG
jgi:tight adherence protein B